MELREAMNILEAVLFAAGEPISSKKLCEILTIDQELLENVATELADFYDYNRRGIKLIKLDKSYQLCSRPDYAPYVRAALETRKPNPLSGSAIEVLAIIAYKQPVTKAFIDQIRGVESTYTINSLVEKGLIQSCGRLDVPGRPMLYRTTESFLRSFGISSLKQLPEIDWFNQEEPEQLAFSVLAEQDGAEEVAQ